MKKIALLITVSFISLSCLSQTKSNQNKKYIDELISIMQGSYTSKKQASIDTSYFNISLRMITIWKDKGNYLYVEQALTKKQDKPYRVRIYKISQRNNDEFISEIYTLKNESQWVGKWNDPKSFDSLSLSDIELKKGCEVVLKRIGKNNFTGQTGIKTCASELRGASYATSKVTVLQNQILSWDQGFDNDGKQVWGAEKAGYIFDKI